MMKWSSSTPPAWQASRKSSSHILGFISPVYLAMLVGTMLSGCGDQRPMALSHQGWGTSRLDGRHA